MSLFDIFRQNKHHTEIDVHDQKNISTGKLLEIQRRAEEIRKNSEEIQDIAYHIAVATGRIKEKSDGH